MIFISAGLGGNGFDALADEFEGITYSFYIGSSQTVSGAATVDIGAGAEVTCELSQARVVRAHLKDIRGESVAFAGGISDARRALKVLCAKIMREETLDGIMILYAYSDTFERGVNLSGRKVNLQAAAGGGRVVLGTPLILGSF
ncbi:MAG: YwmB family TATA-box binding protein [Firmicutes bacterium]|nr:YwmB family TATA-box binding protein [Bacillota bacterium]